MCYQYCAGHHFIEASRKLDEIRSAANPHAGKTELLEGLRLSEAKVAETVKQESEKWFAVGSQLKELVSAFGREGVQSFALEGVLGELQVWLQRFLHHSGIELEL